MKIRELIKNINDARLKEIAEFFERNLKRADNLRRLHLDMLDMRILDRVLDSTLEIARLTPKSDHESLKEYGEKLVKQWNDALGAGPKFLERILKEEFDRFEKGKKTFFRHIPSTIKTLEQSAVTAMWSALEVTASDVWVAAVNASPEKFGDKVFAAYKDFKEGFSSRKIDLWLLSKYKFDLRHHIADIVRTRIDFTNLDEIKQAYNTAFDLDRTSQAAVDWEVLRKLVLTRNLIAHRSGIIDAKFKEETNCPDKIGTEINLPEELIIEYHSIVEDTGAVLIKTADDALQA